MEGDILSGTKLEPTCYHALTKLLMSLEVPLAMILEGGYHPGLISLSTINVVAALLGKTEVPRYPPGAVKIGKRNKAFRHADVEALLLLEAVKRRLNSFPVWSAAELGGACFKVDEKKMMEAASVWNRIQSVISPSSLNRSAPERPTQAHSKTGKRGPLVLGDSKIDDGISQDKEGGDDSFGLSSQFRRSLSLNDSKPTGAANSNLSGLKIKLKLSAAAPRPAASSPLRERPPAL